MDTAFRPETRYRLVVQSGPDRKSHYNGDLATLAVNAMKQLEQSTKLGAAAWIAEHGAVMTLTQWAFDANQVGFEVTPTPLSGDEIETLVTMGQEGINIFWLACLTGLVVGEQTN